MGNITVQYSTPSIILMLPIRIVLYADTEIVSVKSPYWYISPSIDVQEMYNMNIGEYHSHFIPGLNSILMSTVFSVLIYFSSTVIGVILFPTLLVYFHSQYFKFLLSISTFCLYNAIPHP